ncbi:MAG: sulfotransferase family protein [Candidatus Helarchaeota archaeon]
MNERLYLPFVRTHVKSQPYFFIIGSQRSGTTLLRLLLNSHSNVAVPTESTFLMPFLRKRKILNSNPLPYNEKKRIIQYLSRNSQFSKWKISESVLTEKMGNSLTMKELISILYETFALRYDKLICGDKSPTFIRKLGVISKTFPKAKFIHIVRDGRDTYLSLRKKKASGTNSVTLSAFEWYIKNNLIIRQMRNMKNQFLTIRYEDLIIDPKKELKRICNFLNISYENKMLEFWKQSNKFIANHHSRKIFKPIDNSNAFKWKKELRNKEIIKYTYFAAKILKKFNYETNQKKISLVTKFIWWTELFAYLPIRLIRIFYIALYMRVASKLGFAVGSNYYN